MCVLCVGGRGHATHIKSLMTNLWSCHVSLGVGHQTAKRLQALGLVSVQDLQLFPLNDLVREFGGPSAQRLKNLASGVDDSPVTPTGAPQVDRGYPLNYCNSCIFALSCAFWELREAF